MIKASFGVYGARHGLKWYGPRVWNSYMHEMELCVDKWMSTALQYKWRSFGFCERADCIGHVRPPTRNKWNWQVHFDCQIIMVKWSIGYWFEMSSSGHCAQFSCINHKWCDEVIAIKYSFYFLDKCSNFPSRLNKKEKVRHAVHSLNCSKLWYASQNRRTECFSKNRYECRAPLVVVVVSFAATRKRSTCATFISPISYSAYLNNGFMWATNRYDVIKCGLIGVDYTPKKPGESLYWFEDGFCILAEYKRFQ